MRKKSQSEGEFHPIVHTDQLLWMMSCHDRRQSRVSLQITALVAFCLADGPPQIKFFIHADSEVGKQTFG